MGGLFRVQIQMLILGSCLESVISQPPVIRGVTGAEVMLPCIYTEPLTEVNVFWRDRNNNAVLDIKNNSTSSPSPKYSGRVSSFQLQYKDGNFSIILKKVQLEDAGMYDCNIPDEGIAQTVQLLVSDPAPTPEDRKEATPPSGGAAGPTFLHLAVISAVSLLFWFLRFH